MTGARTYRAEVSLDDGWWMIHIVELDVVTQATSWDEVEMMARDLIACVLDLNIADVNVDIVAVSGEATP